MDSDTSLAAGSVIFGLIAGWFFYVGLSADVSVMTDAGEVANLQMMHMQATNIAIGIGAAIVAAVLAVGSAIVGAILKASAPPSQS